MTLAWQALSQGIVDSLPLALRTRRVARVLMKTRDDRGPHMLGHHQVVSQIESRRIHPPAEKLERIGKVGAIVRDSATVGHVNRHAVTSARASSPAASNWRGAAARCA